MEIVNKSVFHDYELVERLEAGVALLGMEAKSLKTGGGSLEGAFVRIIGGQASLINAQIFPYTFARPQGYDPKRTRKLLLHKNQLIHLEQKIKSGNLTLVPVRFYTTGPRVKLEIALARGKKLFEKREKIRRADMRRDLEREFRGKVKGQ